MNNEIDLLQIKIAKAKEELPEIARVVIDSINWKELIFGMNNKFNSEQLEHLSIETELLLCGITSTEEYPKELETRMKISKNEVNLLLNELDRLIFKKMQEEVEDKIDKQEKILISNKPLILDPHFTKLPKDIQEAIAASDWREKVYNISDKYKINIEQTGILEEIVIKIMAGSITAIQFEDEIKTKIALPTDKTKELISEINENILKNIKEILVNKPEEKNEELVPLPPYVETKKNTDILLKNENSFDEPPLPPPAYKIEVAIPKEIIINKEIPAVMELNEDGELVSSKIPASENVNNSNDSYKEHGIEILSTEENNISSHSIVPIIKKEEKVEYREEIPEQIEILNTGIPSAIKKIEEPIPSRISSFDKKNIIESKLFAKTASQSVVTDYSIPKIGSILSPLNKIQASMPTKPHDPYHEEI